MTSALFIVGLVLVVAGLVLLIMASQAKPSPISSNGPGPEGMLEDVRKLIEEFNKLLDKFEKQFRVGVFVMSVGLALIGIAAYLEAKDANDLAKKASVALVVRT